MVIFPRRWEGNVFFFRGTIAFDGFSMVLLPTDHHHSVSSERLISTFETRSRLSLFQSHASRRDREFLSFSLMLRDEIENFFLSVSCFETRSRISVFQSRASRQAREFVHLISGFETRPRNSVISSQASRRERDFFLAFS